MAHHEVAPCHTELDEVGNVPNGTFSFFWFRFDSVGSGSICTFQYFRV